MLQDRQERSLEHPYAEFNLLTRSCINLTHRISRMKLRADIATEIENDLKYLEGKVLDVLQRLSVEEVVKSLLQFSIQTPHPLPSLQSVDQFPFQSPEAGLLLISCFSCLCFIHLNPYTMQTYRSDLNGHKLCSANLPSPCVSRSTLPQ